MRDAFPLSAAARAASVGGISVLKTKSSSVARFTPLTRTSPGVSFTMRRAAIVALPAGRSVKITCAPVRASWSRRVCSMSSGVMPIIESTTSLSAMPQIWPTAETSPPANSPCPTTMARGLFGLSPAFSFMIFLQILANVVCRRRFHATDQPLVEGFRGVYAGIAEEMVHGDDFRDHGDVLPRIEEHCHLRQLDVQNGGRLHVEPDALDDCVLIPLFQLDDDLDSFLLPNSPDAEYCLDINQADTADLHVVALEIVGTSDQDIVPALAGDDQIVGNETVSPFHQIQHALGLADAALAGEEQADPEDVCQRPVQRNRRRELHLQHRLDATIELRGFQLGANDRDARRTGRLLEADRQALALGNEDCGNRE